MDRRLSGKTVLITRPRNQAAELAALLRRHGARVLAGPAIRIAPPARWAGLDAALRRLPEYDAVIFTSANGVESFFRRSRRVLGRPPPRPKRLYAIGPATARALAGRGWRGVRVPETYEGGALARFIAGRGGRVRGWRILLPRAAEARDVLPKTLARAGARVEVKTAYRALPDPRGVRLIRKAAAGGGLHAVTFTSPSTVRGFFGALGPRQSRKLLGRIPAACIGPITAAELRKKGVRNILQARRFTAAGLLRALLNGL